MEFGILGPLQVLVADRVLSIPARSKPATVLAALLVHCNQVVSARRLIDWLWGDEPPDDAAAALRIHVSRLRTALAGRPDSEHVLVSRGSGYALRIPPEAVDSYRFERLVIAAQAVHSANPASTASCLREALSLWRGPALDGFGERPFARAESLRLEEMRLAAIEDLMDAEMALGRHAVITGELQSLVAQHPTRERLTAQLMCALYRSGRQAHALESYHKLRGRLVDELGIEPSLQLRKLERAILRQELQEPSSWAGAERRTHVGEVSETPPIGAGLLPGRTPFVAREAERAHLSALMEQASAGEGRLVVIGGEPGVGKTRLCEEIASKARRQGFLVRTGHCLETAAQLPFMPWVEMIEAAARETPPEVFRQALGEAAPEMARIVPQLRRLFPDIPPPFELPPEQQRRFMFNSLGDFVTRHALTEPRLYVLEDLHWADESSLLFLSHLAERLPTISLLVIGTYRDTPIDISPLLAETLSAFVRRRQASLLSLGCHSQPEVAALLRALSGHDPPAEVTAAIYAETEGNAFFVEEVFRHLLESGGLLDDQGDFRADLRIDELDVPQNVRLVTGQRLDRLGEVTRQVLTIGAVIGRHFSFELLEAVAEVDDLALLDALDEAERSRLLFSEPLARETHLWFGHELIRQTLLARLSSPRRQRHHLRVASVLEGVYAADLELHAADIAEHLIEAGSSADLAALFRYLVLAGKRALESAAFEAALRHFHRAASLAAHTPEVERADMFSLLGMAERGAGNWSDAVLAWRTAIEIREELGDPEAIGRACLVAAYSVTWGSRWIEGKELAQRGLEALDDRLSADRVRLLAMSAAFHMGSAGHGAVHYEQSMDRFAEAIALAEQLEDPEVLGYVLVWKAITHVFYAEGHESVETGLRAAEMMRAAGELWHLSVVLGYLSLSLVSLGRFDDVRRVVRELLPLAERLGNHPALLHCRRAEGMINYFETGDPDALESLARADIELCERAGLAWSSHGRTWLALADFLRGNWDAAILNEPWHSVSSPGEFSATEWAPQFEYWAYAGHRDIALAMLEERRAELPRLGEPNGYGRWIMLLSVVEGLVVLGEMTQAADLYSLVRECIERTALVSPILNDGRLPNRIAGMAAAAGSNWAVAESHFAAALEQAVKLPHRSEQAHTQRFYGRFLMERGGPGDRIRARALLEQAVAGYRSMGMPRHVAMVQELL